ncbi:MAG: PAC2 family protein, partial [Thermoplasmatota archaeon]
VILTGDFQPMSPDGQYDLVEGVLDKIPDCKELYTIGGFGLGATVDEPSVMGAATDLEMVASLKEHGVRFEEEEPGAGIIGASGLFLGVGMQRGLRGACLMGETSGFLPDPQSAAKVLTVLRAHIGLVVDAENLDEEAEELARIASQLKDGETFGPVDDMHYG